MGKPQGTISAHWKGLLSVLLMAVMICAAAVLPKASVEAAAPPAAPSSAAPTATGAPTVPAATAAPTTAPAAGASAEVSLNDILQQITAQAKIDQELLAELNSGAYTLQNPFVVVDPYGVSPLAAVALFQTGEPMNISIHISGKTKLADVDFTFDGYQTTHEIPILGLYSGWNNDVTITGKTESGAEQSVTLKVKTDPLPVSLAQTAIVTYLPDAAACEPGFNFLGGYASAALDANGEYRWCLSDQLGKIFSYSNGKAIYASVNQYILHISPLGKISDVYFIQNGSHHDICLTDHQTLLVCGNSVNSIEDQLLEIDLATGSILHSLDYKNILQHARAFGVYYTNSDWMHMNSVVEYGGNVIVSSNHQSTVVCNSWDGKIKWMLCDPTGYLAMYQPYILKPIGRNFEYPYNQHAVEVLPDQDHNPDTVDIILFDNGSSRNAANGTSWPPLYSRMARYRINEKERTVEQIWAYGKDQPELFTSVCGDANMLDNGDVLGLFQLESGTPADPEKYHVSVDLCEVGTEGNLVWECQISSTRPDDFYNGYRVERLAMYWSGANDLQIGKPAQVLVPKELLNENAN